MFFLIGVLFAPIGGLLVWGSSRVSEFTLDYSQCERQASGTLANMPSSQYSYSMASGASGPTATPQWSFTNSSDGVAVCTLQFQVPSTIPKPVFMYYKLTNVRSRSSAELTPAVLPKSCAISPSAVLTRRPPLRQVVQFGSAEGRRRLVWFGPGQPMSAARRARVQNHLPVRAHREQRLQRCGDNRRHR